MSNNNWEEFQNIITPSSIDNTYSNVSQSEYDNKSGENHISTKLEEIINHQNNTMVHESSTNIFKEIENKIQFFKKSVFEDVTAYKIPEKIKDFNEAHSIEDRLKNLEIERNKELPCTEHTKINCLDEDLGFSIDNCLSNLLTLKKKIVEHFNHVKQAEERLENEVSRIDTSFNHIQHLQTFSNSIVEKDLKISFDKNIDTIYTNIIEASNVKKLYAEYINILKKHRYYIQCLHELKTLSSKPTCPFCLTNEIDTVIVSCGHSCCNQCIMQLGDRCGACRTKITKIQRLYII